MSEKIKTINTEGETYVIPSDDVFDVEKAGIKRGEDAKWSDFEVLGSNDAAESEFVPTEQDPAKLQEALDKIKRNKFIGISVLDALGKVA